MIWSPVSFNGSHHQPMTKKSLIDLVSTYNTLIPVVKHLSLLLLSQSTNTVCHPLLAQHHPAKLLNTPRLFAKERMTSQSHPPSSGSAPPLKCFTNCQLCISGELVPQDLYFSPETGLITPNYYYRSEGVERIDLGGRVVAPGFLELQINGAEGVHFTGLGAKGGKGDGEMEEEDAERLRKVAEWEVRCGVTGWWATVPTVERERWVEVCIIFSPLLMKLCYSLCLSC